MSAPYRQTTGIVPFHVYKTFVDEVVGTGMFAAVWRRTVTMLEQQGAQEESLVEFSSPPTISRIGDTSLGTLHCPVRLLTPAEVIAYEAQPG